MNAVEISAHVLAGLSTDATIIVVIGVQVAKVGSASRNIRKYRGCL